MYSALSGEQVRQLTDTLQVFEAFCEAEKEMAMRFAGSMSWKKRHGRAYLYRIIKGRETSLGSESDETRKMYDAFRRGRADAVRRVKSLSERLDELAPVNQAMRLGRVPLISARILRILDAENVLGKDLMVVGTHALFAYEAAAAVQFGANLVATADIDLLLDSRQRLRIASPGLKRKGLLNSLRRVDRTFKATRGWRYRAVNDKGFMVDLISPQGKNPMSKSGRLQLGSEVDDLMAAEIEGLIWLLNVPKFEATALAEDGRPVRIPCPDPRAFAAHKLWVARRIDRDPAKKDRDQAQARSLLRLLKERLVQYPLERGQLSALPDHLMEMLLDED